jgi:hypothetical protein
MSVAVITFNDVPIINQTFKYERLGRMAMENRQIYCDRHDYRLIADVPIARDRPSCWAKIPAILDAFEDNSWVLWADSDTLIFDHSRKIEDFVDPEFDLIVQSHEQFFRTLGIPLDRGLSRMPINTGVFLMRASAWAREFLHRAYMQTQFISRGEVWNGIGEQEAMISILRQNPEFRNRIKYVDGLQNHPRFFRKGDLFVHFYGNHAPHRLPLPECEEVLARWENANRRAEPFPADIRRFHWCCIQNKQPESAIVRGDLSHYLYSPEDLEPDGLLDCQNAVNLRV